MMEAEATPPPSAPPPDSGSGSDPNDVRNLLTMARQLIDQGKPSQALQAVTILSQFYFNCFNLCFFLLILNATCFLLPCFAAVVISYIISLLFSHIHKSSLSDWSCFPYNFPLSFICKVIDICWYLVHKLMMQLLLNLQGFFFLS